MLAGPDGRVAAHGLWFHGRSSASLRPWVDLVAPDLSVLGAVAATLGPGASLMVAYDADDTERALRRKAPAAATPIGSALLAAGCRWFKDWYFAEGGREGGTKLQGTVPLDDEHRIRAESVLAHQLRAFLMRPGIDDIDRRAATNALSIVAP